MSIRIENSHAVSRLAKRITPEELANELLKFENADRAFEQSRNTRDGQVAELPARPEARRLAA